MLWVYCNNLENRTKEMNPPRGTGWTGMLESRKLDQMDFSFALWRMQVSKNFTIACFSDNNLCMHQEILNSNWPARQAHACLPPPSDLKRYCCRFQRIVIRKEWLSHMNATSIWNLWVKASVKFGVKYCIILAAFWSGPIIKCCFRYCIYKAAVQVLSPYLKDWFGRSNFRHNPKKGRGAFCP